MDRPVLSKYERASTISARMQQICNGSQTPPGTTTDETLAELVQRELQEGLIPFKLARVFPDNTTQVFRLSEMVISDSAAAPVVPK
jgi:DNA-directed RNA polymerase subunit K/omega